MKLTTTRFPPRMPRALVPGDQVAVTAPSSGVEPSRHARLEQELPA